jgi:hypothetical protein
MVAVFINLRRLTGAQQVVRLRKWTIASFSSPAPNIVKWKVLRRWGGDKTWVETGTYLGETTAFLSEFSKIVYTLEPENSLFLRAAEKFKENSNVVIMGGSSEEKLLGLLNSFTNEEIQDVSFWLDGHYSAGITFQGDKETPIVFELNALEQFLPSITKVTIFVDDVRQFAKSDESENHYPSLSSLVSFADSHELYWIIEHDIFIMTNRHSNFTNR